MRKKILLLCAFFAMVFLAYSPAEAIVHVEGRYWFTSLDSSKVKSGSTGTEIDMVDTLGVGKRENFPEFRLDLNMFDHHIRYSYVPLSWSGSKVISQDINYGDKTYTVNSQVDSDLDIGYHRFGYRYDIINMLGNKLGIILDIKMLNIDAKLRAPDAGVEETRSYTAPVPTIGVGAQIGLPFLFSVGAEVTGITYSGNYLVDGEAAVNLSPLPFTTISAGYRLLAVKVEHGDDRADFRLNGPFVGLRVGF